MSQTAYTDRSDIVKLSSWTNPLCLGFLKLLLVSLILDIDIYVFDRDESKPLGCLNATWTIFLMN